MTRFGAGYLIPMDNFEMLINRDTERRFGQLIGMKYDVSKQVIRDKNHRKRVFHFLKYGDFGKIYILLGFQQAIRDKNHREQVFHFLKY